MNARGNNTGKLWLPSRRGVIITLLVGSNIILIRIIGALVYKGHSLENEVSRLKSLRMNCTQPPAVSKDHLIKMEKIKKQLCVNSDSDCAVCPAGWLLHGADCYYYSAARERRTWKRSQDWCSVMGAHLLVLQDKKELEFINVLLGQQSDDKFWIGMNRDGDEWKWVNGQQTSSSLFQPPNESLEDCVLLQQSGEHYAEDCNTEHRWICQEKAVKIDFNVTYY